MNLCIKISSIVSIIICKFLFLCFVLPVLAQDTGRLSQSDVVGAEGGENNLEFLRNLEEELARGSTDNDSNLRIVKAYIEYQSARYDHLTKILELQIDILEWQGIASNIVLSLVVIVVLAGIGFSAFQLKKSLDLGRPQAESELELSASKIRISSSVTGIIILALSLGFLYLFATEIFTLTPIDIDS